MQSSDQPGDHRGLPYLLLHLEPVKQTGRRPLYSQRGNVDLDHGSGWDSDHPHTQQVWRVGAGVVWRAEAALRVSQNPSTPWERERTERTIPLGEDGHKLQYKQPFCLNLLRVSDGGILAGCGAAVLSRWLLLAGIVGKVGDAPSPALSRSGGLVDSSWSSTAWLFISESGTETDRINKAQRYLSSNSTNRATLAKPWFLMFSVCMECLYGIWL